MQGKTKYRVRGMGKTEVSRRRKRRRGRRKKRREVSSDMHRDNDQANGTRLGSAPGPSWRQTAQTAQTAQIIGSPQVH